MSQDTKDKNVAPAAPKQSIGQTILIVFLVLVVGLIFGIGQSSLTMAMGSKAVQEIAGDLTNVDYDRFTRVKAITSALEQGRRPQDMQDNDWRYIEYFAQRFGTNQLLVGKLAQKHDMGPSGEELKAEVKRYLQRPIPDPDYKTMGAGIKAVIDADEKGRTLTPSELEEFIAIIRAYDNYSSRYTPTVGIDRKVALVFNKLSNEKIKTEEVTISAAALVAQFREAAAKDEEQLLIKYQEIKGDKFVIPQRCHLKILGADVAAIRPAVVVSDEEIGKYYTDNKETDPALKKPAPAEKPKEGEPAPAPKLVIKTLDESRDYIRGKLAGDKAGEVAAELCADFMAALMEEGLVEEGSIVEGKEADINALAKSIKIAETDPRLSKAVQLQVWEKMAADKPDAGSNYDIVDADGKHFAKMTVFNPSLFDKTPGSFFQPIQAVDNKDLHIIQVVEAMTEQSHKPFEAVKDEVILVASAEAAYPELLKQAQALRDAASQMAEPSLVKFFEAEAQKSWAGQVESVDYAPLDSVEAPSDENQIPIADTYPIIHYTQPGKSFYIKSAEKDGDMQRVTIGRVISHALEKQENIDEQRYVNEMKQISSRLSEIDMDLIVKKDMEN